MIFINGYSIEQHPYCGENNGKIVIINENDTTMLNDNELVELLTVAISLMEKKKLVDWVKEKGNEHET